ncbi:MAG: hypothetical protein V1698_01415, partial [bacterium]
MANKQIFDYIKKSLENGFSEQQIRIALSQQGWQDNDIDQAFKEVGECRNLVSAVSGRLNKKLIAKILSGFVALILMGIGGYFVFGLSQNKFKDKTFENGNEILNKIISASKDITSFEISGTAVSLEDGAIKETITTNFTGQIVLPKILKNESVVTRVLKSSDNETTNYTKEKIIFDSKVFEKYASGDNESRWEVTEVIDNPFMLKHELDKFSKPVSWLVFDYAQDLIYIGKEENLYHYKIIKKNLAFYDAKHIIEDNFFVVVGGTGGSGDSLISGDIWINDKFQIIKEKYLIPIYESVEYREKYHEQEKEGLEIEITYSNYNQTFEIKKPIDTSALDEMWKQIAEGKDLGLAQAEYKEKMFAENPDLAVEERDNRRFNDIMIQTHGLLEMYYYSNDKYPDSLSELKYGTGKVPSAPTPVDGNCSAEQNNYRYTKISDDSFQINFCLGKERAP